MQITVKTVKFPLSTSIGELYLVEKDNLPHGNLEVESEDTKDRIPLGLARGTRNIPMTENHRLLLVVDGWNFPEDELLSQLAPDAVDIIGGVRNGEQVMALAQYLPGIRGLIFSHVAYIEDATVFCAGIAKLAELDYLNLTSKSTSEVHPSSFADCIARLIKLKMVVIPCTTYLPALSKLPMLETVVVSDTYRRKAIPASTIESLLEIKTLKHLYLEAADIEDSGLEIIAKVAWLEILDISYSKYSDAGLAHLKRLKKLKRLKINSSDVTDDGIRHVSEIASLEEISASGIDITDHGCALLTNLPELRRLDIRSTSKWRKGSVDVLTAACLRSIAKMSKLEALHLRDVSLTADGVELLSGMKNLIDLGLPDCDLTDAAMESISKVIHLRALNVSSNKGISPRGLSFIGSLPLEELNIYSDDNAVTDDSMSIVGGIQTLRWLNVSHTGISDSGLAKLSLLRKLEYLNIANKDTGITNGGISSLTGLKRLRCIEMAYTNIDDSLMEVLWQFPDLCRVGASFTRLSKEAQKSLRGYSG